MQDIIYEAKVTIIGVPTSAYQLISWGKCFEALICLFTIGVHKRTKFKEIEGLKKCKMDIT